MRMKNKKLNIIAVAFLGLLFFGWITIPSDLTTLIEPQNTTTIDTDFLTVGEDLTYEVSWWFVKIGTIRAKVLNSEILNNNTKYNAIAYIDSYSGLPFVDLHAVFETTMDKECFSQSFIGWEKDGNRWKVTKYELDRKKSILIIKKGFADSVNSANYRVDRVDTLRIQSKTQDGLSLLFFARANVKSGKQITMLTMVDSTQETTRFNFMNKQKSIKIDAVEYPIDVIEFDGVGEFKSIFGLGGLFKGWFSNDIARIPIRAKMNVILGTIDIELKQWKRKGWNPPQHIPK